MNLVEWVGRFMESLHFNSDTRWDHEPIIDARSAHEFFSLSLPKGEGRGEGSVLRISASRFMERAGERRSVSMRRSTASNRSKK